jgi:hypothetical protein
MARVWPITAHLQALYQLHSPWIQEELGRQGVRRFPRRDPDLLHGPEKFKTVGESTALHLAGHVPGAVSALPRRRLRRVEGSRRPRRSSRVGEGNDHGAERVLDLHALRASCATLLARAGAHVQVAQRIMRHSDVRTTIAHYTKLGVADFAAAVDQVAAFVRADLAAQKVAAPLAADSAPVGASRDNSGPQPRSSAKSQAHG